MREKPTAQILNFSICIALTFIFNTTNAKIVYTDIDPDVTNSQTTDGTNLYPIDFNNDQITDVNLKIFKGTRAIQFGTFTGSAVEIIAGTGNYIKNHETNTYDVHDFSIEEIINPNATYWRDYGYIRLTGINNLGSFGSGPPVGDYFFYNQDRYIGVKFLIGSNVHLAWIRFELLTENSYSVKGYAYEDIANESITAGRTSTPTGISEYLNSNTIIKNYNNEIFVEFRTPFNGKIEVLELNGNVVKSAYISGNSGSMNLISQTPGIYILLISNREGMMGRKIAIQ